MEIEPFDEKPAGPLDRGETDELEFELLVASMGDALMASDLTDLDYAYAEIPDELPAEVESKLPDFLAAAAQVAMPQEEQVEIAAIMEGFAAGGEHQASMITATDLDGTKVLQPAGEGFLRPVPTDVLERGGIGFEVEVSTTEASGDEPYAVGFVATRMIVGTLAPDPAEASWLPSEPVEATETHIVCVVFGGQERPYSEVLARSALLIARPGNDPEGPTEPILTVEIAPLELDEIRRIVRAIEQA